MKAHLSKEFWELIEKAAANGCRIERNGHVVKVFAPKREQGLMTCHVTPTGIHPLRRWLKRTCNV